MQQDRLIGAHAQRLQKQASLASLVGTAIGASGILGVVGAPIAVALGASAGLAPYLGAAALVASLPIVAAALKGVVYGAGKEAS